MKKCITWFFSLLLIMIILLCIFKRQPTDFTEIKLDNLKRVRLESPGLSIGVDGDVIAENPYAIRQKIKGKGLCQKPFSRYINCFYIEEETLSGEDIEGLKKSRKNFKLDNDGVLYYRTWRTSEGNGQPKDHLLGYIVIRDRSFYLTSEYQGHIEFCDARWCFPYIRTIELLEE